jgi:CubicO group peptidase (beta-lactamase class C family)
VFGIIEQYNDGHLLPTHSAIQIVSAGSVSNSMDLETLTSIFPPSFLVEAGIPTASVAVLSEKTHTTSTHVITSAYEDKDTLYQACSISKAITALAVAKLIDQGLLTYDTKVANHLPQDIVELVVDGKTRHLFQHLTITHLLSHTSGLSQHSFPGYDVRDELPTASDVLAGKPPANTPWVHFATFPGAQFSYSGAGFVILQLFLENLLSKPFTTIMRETVLEPLKMTRSFFDPLPEIETNYSVPYLTGYLKAPSGPYRFVELAAAGLWTTPSDLLKAIAATQASLSSPQSEFLSKATAEKMLQPVHRNIRGANSIARGWFVTEAAFGHSGGNEPGYGCYVVGLRPRPEDGNVASRDHDAIPWGGAVAVMTNGPYTHQAVWQVVSAVFYLQHWPLAALPGGVADDEWRAMPALVGTAVEDSWQGWIGDWEDGWKIFVMDEKPAIQFRELEAMALVAAAAPVQFLASGKNAIALVVEGLEVQITLTWKDDERVVRILQRESKVLRRMVT